MSPRPKFHAADVVWLVVILACIGAGITLRLTAGVTSFVDSPTAILGGGLITVGVIVFVIWAKRPPR
jgi:hypothetical protein